MKMLVVCSMILCVSVYGGGLYDRQCKAVQERTAARIARNQAAAAHRMKIVECVPVITSISKMIQSVL